MKKIALLWVGNVIYSTEFFKKRLKNLVNPGRRPAIEAARRVRVCGDQSQHLHLRVKQLRVSVERGTRRWRYCAEFRVLLRFDYSRNPT